MILSLGKFPSLCESVISPVPSGKGKTYLIGLLRESHEDNVSKVLSTYLAQSPEVTFSDISSLNDPSFKDEVQSF